MRKISLSKYLSTCGVYIITNTVNNRKYIGQSTNIQARISDHVDRLINNIHNNIGLMEDFRYFGVSVFTVKILELCNKEDLLKREEFYILRYAKNGHRLYNITSFRTGTGRW